MKSNKRSSVQEDGAGGTSGSLYRQCDDSASRSTSTRPRAVPPASEYNKYKCTGDHVQNGDTMTEATNVHSNPECDSSENTFEDNLATFADVVRSANWKESSIMVAVRYVRNIAAALQGKDPVQWTEMDIQNLLVSEKFTGWKSGTQKTSKVHLKAYLTIHRRPDLLLPSNYHFWKDRKAYSGGSNRYDELKAKAPSQAEVEKVLAICEDVMLTSKSSTEVYRHMALWFAAAYGLRCLEVAGLRICDVRLDEKTLHVEQSKGDKSRDVFMDVTISDEMWTRFMAARSSLLDISMSRVADEVIVAKLSSLSDRAANLFFGRENGTTGEPISPASIGHMLRRLASKVLGRSVNAHSFRHAKAFYLVEVARVPMTTAAQYLGHSNIQQTVDYCYTGVEDQRAAFAVGNGGPVEVAPAPAPTPATSGKLDAAIGALTAAYSRGDLSAEAFAAAVAALSSGL